MRFVIAGFDPFDKNDVNPSQVAVEGLPEAIELTNDSAPITPVILQTCCNDAVAELETRIAALGDDPFFLLLSGYAGKRERIGLERFALNVRQYRVADNQGHQWQEEYLDKQAPEAIRTRVPLFDLQDYLAAKGYACEVSNHAGTFVCNEIYFRALQRWGSAGNCAGVLFVHVPNVENYARVISTKGVQAQAERIEEEYTRALVDIACFIGDRVSLQA